MVWQQRITLPAYQKGFHRIDDEILHALRELKPTGILFIHLLHTSAALTINENCDPDVLHDLELYFDRIAPQELSGLKHCEEGPDDMPAHVLSSLVGNSISVPIKEGKLVLGVWQGIYLCEFRQAQRKRTIILTVLN